MEASAAKLIGAGIACLALAGAGVGIGNIEAGSGNRSRGGVAGAVGGVIEPVRRRSERCFDRLSTNGIFE